MRSTAVGIPGELGEGAELARADGDALGSRLHPAEGVHLEHAEVGVGVAVVFAERRLDATRAISGRFPDGPAMNAAILQLLVN